MFVYLLHSPKKNGQPSEGSILAKAMKKIVKNEISNEPNPASKKSCICAPTNHPGSFRCHLHRIGDTQKLAVKLTVIQRGTQSFNSINTNSQKHSHQQLSRFGRAALSQYQHPSDRNKEERLSEALNVSLVKTTKGSC